MILRYIKQYPFSLALIAIVIFLSFFRPPSVKVPTFIGIDKLVHFFMYAGMSGCLWIEFFFNHREGMLNVHHAIIGAIIAPILFSGAVELLQEHLTKYRGGEWLDFLANTCGVLTATAVAWYIIRPFIIKPSKQ